MFPADSRQQLLNLLHDQPVAALGTLHQGEPFVSMVPFLRQPGQARFLIHVSALAAHTQDMQNHAGVSLMVMQAADPQTLPQALARATFQCQAQRLERSDAAWPDAQRAYLARFPQSEELFGFGDFALFTLAARTGPFLVTFCFAAAFLFVFAIDRRGSRTQGVRVRER